MATFEKLNLWSYTEAAQRPQGHLETRRRREGFEEIVQGLSERDATYEAKRCLSCGNCFECGGCFAACPEDMTAWMDRRDYESVRQMKGSMSQSKVADPTSFERANYIKMLESYESPYLT